MSEYILVEYYRGDNVPSERFSKAADVTAGIAFTIMMLCIPSSIVGLVLTATTEQTNPWMYLLLGSMICGVLSFIVGMISASENRFVVYVASLIIDTGNKMLVEKGITSLRFENYLSRYMSFDDLKQLNTDVEHYLGENPESEAFDNIVTLIKEYISPVVEEISRPELERQRQLNLELVSRNYGVSKSLGN